MFSVVIPIYNHARFVSESVRSALLSPLVQEILLLDDGSKDGSAGIASQLSAAHPGRVRNVTSPDGGNRGAHNRLNELVALAKCEWIAILNSDDIFVKGRFECIVEAPGFPDCDFIFGDLLFIDERGALVGSKRGPLDVGLLWRPLIDPGQPAEQGLLDLLSVENYLITTSNMAFRKTLHERLGGFADYRYVHDWDFALRAMSLGRPRYIQRFLTGYRKHPRNTIKEDAGRSYRETREMFDRFANDFPEISRRPQFQTVIRRLAHPSSAIFHDSANDSRIQPRGAQRTSSVPQARGRDNGNAGLFSRLHSVLSAPKGSVSKTDPEVPPAVAAIRERIAPIELTVSPSESRRVNLLIPTVDFNYFFGGYIAKLNLARRLAEIGFRVRIVIVDQCDYQPRIWKQQLRHFDGLESVLDSCELAYLFDRGTPLGVSPNDCFIATTWWTAHIAHRAVTRLGQRAFLYLIQEFEPFTFPMGTFASLAQQSYSFPHYALFSTEFLRDYFRQSRLGVFAEGNREGEEMSAVFQNAISAVAPVALDLLRSRSSRKLLFYARPEGHAARNMFELGWLALCEAIDQGVFDDRWEFTGIGSMATSDRMHLTQGRYLKLLHRQNQANYKRVLTEHDLGLSLMYTPHPSLVPIEMASAGMVVVTNTFRNKTADLLRAVSPSLVGVEPTMDGVVAGLKAAVPRVEQLEERVRGAQVNWCRDWNSAFDRALLQRVESFVETISK